MTECVPDDDIPSSAFTATENPRFGICRGVWHEVGTIFHDGQTLVVGQLRTYICQCRIDKKIELGCLITSNRRGRPVGGVQLLPHLADSGTGDRVARCASILCNLASEGAELDPRVQLPVVDGQTAHCT